MIAGCGMAALHRPSRRGNTAGASKGVAGTSGKTGGLNTGSGVPESTGSLEVKFIDLVGSNGCKAKPPFRQLVKSGVQSLTMQGAARNRSGLS
jgi:hypothetical protein